MSEPSTPRHAYVKPEPNTPTGEPLVPWYRNERLKFMSSLTSAGAMRLLIITMAIFVVIVAVGGVYLVDLGSANSKLSKDIKDTINKRTQDRLDFQRSIQEQSNKNKKDIQELACFAANAVPRGTNKFTDGLAIKYSCPPYKPVNP